jgi:membrane protease YdiL (CAAX protease family)
MQLALISVVAGISEETLFRAVVQASLAEPVGSTIALILTSLLFGAAHLITLTYAVLATVMGAYLGLIWIWTGNLLTPMIAHALYDFAALLYLLRLYRPRSFPEDSE